MANHHFGKFADVWKHMVLDEVLAHVKPARYAETHAGSAAYPMIHDAERDYGVLQFLDRASFSDTLAASAFHNVVSRFVTGEPALYPGSALQAMTLLGDDCAYLLCDTDPVSVVDLGRYAGRLELSRCDVLHGDGMSAVHERLTDRLTTVVHIDPFDPFAREAGGLSALELAAEVADAGHSLVYWYGYDSPYERSWALAVIGSRTGTSLWCGDLMVGSPAGFSDRNGDLGIATTPGTGCGVVLAHATTPVVDRCEELAHALVETYEGAALPSGLPGRLDLTVVTT